MLFIAPGSSSMPLSERGTGTVSRRADEASDTEPMPCRLIAIMTGRWTVDSEISYVTGLVGMASDHGDVHCLGLG